jgi:hypothetical protein
MMAEKRHWLADSTPPGGGILAVLYKIRCFSMYWLIRVLNKELPMSLLFRPNYSLSVFKGGVIAALFLAILAWQSMAQPPAAPLAARFVEKAAIDVNRLPLLFIANDESQAQPSFHAKSTGGVLNFAPDKVTLSLSTPSAARNPQTLHLHFVGAVETATLVGLDRQKTVINYYSGSDTTQWRTQVPTFSSVQYQGLYPGIDLIYDGTPAALKGTYYLAPGADPRQIRWRYAGVDKVAIDRATGNLQITLPDQQVVVEQAPIAWQEIGGRHTPVAIEYTLQDGQVGFALPAGYATDHQLVIDPTLDFSTFLGGTSSDYIRGIDVDSAGNIYVTGVTSSDDIAGVPGTSNGNTAIFAAKLDATASAVAWVTYLDGREGEQGRDIAVDQSGRVWVVGYTASSNFPTTSDAYQPAFGGFYDLIAVQLNGANGVVQYSTFFGFSDLDEGNGVAVDANGNVYITGQLDQNQVLALKFSPEHALLYGVQFGGDGLDKGNDIAVDASGRAYITGRTGGIAENNFDVVNGMQTSCARYSQFECSDDAFVSILNAEGTSLDYSSYLGGGGDPGRTAGTDEGHAIAVDGAGNIYVAGTTNSESFPVANPFQAQLGGSNALSDGFIAKLAPAGDDFVFSTYVGGKFSDDLLALDVDESGNLTVVGYTNSPDFPTANALQPDLITGGNCGSYFCEDVFITQFDANGALTFSSYLGGIVEDYGYALTVHNGKVFLAGNTYSSGFPTTAGVVQPMKLPSWDGFVSKISLSAAEPTATPTSTPTATATATATATPTVTNTPTATSVPPVDQPNQLYLPLIQR